MFTRFLGLLTVVACLGAAALAQVAPKPKPPADPANPLPKGKTKDAQRDPIVDKDRPIDKNRPRDQPKDRSREKDRKRDQDRDRDRDRIRDGKKDPPERRFPQDPRRDLDVTGNFIRFDRDRRTLWLGSGEAGRQTSYQIGDDSRVTIDGRPGRFEDLREGDPVRLRLSPDRTTILDAHVGGPLQRGTITDVDVVRQRLTFKAGDGSAKTVSVPAGADIIIDGGDRVLGDLKTGLPVSVWLSRDQKVALWVMAGRGVAPPDKEERPRKVNEPSRDDRPPEPAGLRPAARVDPPTAGAAASRPPVETPGAIVPPAPGAVPLTRPHSVPDDDLRMAVERRLWRDFNFPFDGVDVYVSRGIVTLSGEVSSLMAKDRAVRIAGSTLGVRSLVDQLKVRRYALTDEQVREGVTRALAADPAADAYEVQAHVDAGVVTLSGAVDSRTEAELAIQVARGVLGVLGVRNEIRIKAGKPRSDEDLARDVRARLAWDRRLDPAEIEVKAEGGVVTLTGAVGSAAEKWQAEQNAWVSGVRAVNADGLQVDRWWDRASLRGPNPARTDAAIRQAIQDAFLYDPRVTSYKVGVSVVDGVATLTGVVEDLAAKWAAERNAFNTVGVHRVRNLIKVRGVRDVSDAQLIEGVRATFARDPLLAGTEIRVNAVNGQVYLRGTVRSDFERDHAAGLATRVTGVVGVRNLLVPDFTRTGPAVGTSANWDSDLRDDIRDELQWNPHVNATYMHVTVEDGVATLTGVVNSESERWAAVQSALRAGPRKVVDRLQVLSDRETGRR
jgi:osmotically-inducible protein OsmY